MHLLLVPYLAGSLLLLGAGWAKLRRPDGTARALRTQGLPSSRPLVRLLGAAEAVLALAALAGVPGAAVGTAVAYAAFTGFVLLALLRGRPLSSCGCFGEPDLPPTATHVAVTSLFAATGAAVASGSGATASGAPGLPGLLGAGVGPALAVLGATAVTTWLALAVLTALPRLAAARRPVPIPGA
ncbi:hypothetical protein NUM3379_39200 [Kineococcus sp. NUM-3379]